MKRERRRFIAVLLLLLAASTTGCRQSPIPDVIERVEAWQEVPRGQVLSTPHFEIRTTLEDPRRNRELAATLESAISRFEELAGLPSVVGGNTGGDRRAAATQPARLPVVVFATRREWETFTRQAYPGEAVEYLRIRRGGYTIGERSVLYDIGRGSTLGVAVHEAWHQFCARRFRRRLPPAVEEGLASRFDRVRLVEGRVELVELPSPERLEALRSMLRENRVLTLRELLTMHAGDVLGTSRGRVEAFYAQCWALSEFLLHGENGRHSASLRRMFRDLSGQAEVETSWSPDQAVILFSRYFGEPETLDPAFRRFLVALSR